MNGRQSGNVPATVPPFRPLMAVANNMVRNVRLAVQQQQQQPQPFSQKQQQQQQLQPLSFSKKQQQSLLKPLPVPEFAALPQSIAKVAVEASSPPPQLFAVHRQSPLPSVGRLTVPQMVQPMTSPALMSQQPQQFLQSQQLQPQQQPPLMSSPVFTPPSQQQSPVYYHNTMQLAANRRYNVSAIEI